MLWHGWPGFLIPLFFVVAFIVFFWHVVSLNSYDLLCKNELFL